MDTNAFCCTRVVRAVQIALAAVICIPIAWIAMETVDGQGAMPRFSDSTNSIELIGCVGGQDAHTAAISGADSSHIEGVGRMIILPGLNPAVDQALREDCNELRKVFQVNAPMFFMEEESGYNAVATPESLEGFVGDGTVLFGRRMMELQYLNGTPDGIPTILAHEFAHILQYKARFPRLATAKWQELHADYMAGWFTGHRSRYKPHTPMNSLIAVYNVGDYAFNHPSHHGTPEERAAAFERGFWLNINGNVSNSAIAFQEGLNFIRGMGAPL